MKSLPPFHIFLLGLWSLLLFGGIIGPRSSTKANNTAAPSPSTLLRMASSTVLVIAAWAWWWLAKDAEVATYALLIALGMTLGLVGDLFMAKLIPFPTGMHVIGGMAAFGLGHIMYIAAIRWLAGQYQIYHAQWNMIWLGWLVIGALGWFFMVAYQQKLTVMHWAALPYALLLASTAGNAHALAANAGQFWPLAVGGALFLFSDLMIAVNMFRNLNAAWVGELVWPTYGPAQALIVYSVWFALQLVK